MRKNRAVAGLTLLVLGSACFLGYFLGYAETSSAEDFFESGQAYYQENRYQPAVIQFLNVLQQDPRHRDARYYLALSYMRQGNGSAAQQELKALLRQNSEDIPASISLGHLYLAAGPSNPQYFREAGDLAKKVLALEPANVTALILAGNAAAGLQDYQSAVKSLERALELDSNNVSALSNLGAFQSLQQNAREAEEAFLRARELSPRNKAVLLSMGHFYTAWGKTEKAEAVLKEALSYHPIDREVYLSLAGLYLRLGRLELAEDTLRTVQKRLPDDPEPSLILIDLYRYQNRSAEAYQYLQQIEEKFPGSLPVAIKSARMLLAKDAKEARRKITKVLEEHPNHQEIHLLMAEAQFRLGEYEQAESTLTPWAFDDQPERHLLLGRIALERREYRRAQQAFETLLTMDKRYVADAHMGLAEVYFRKGMFADADQQLNQLLELQPDHAAGRLLKAALNIAGGRTGKAEQELVRLLKELPQNPWVHHRMGLLQQRLGRPSRAEFHLRKAADLLPDSIEILTDLFRFYVREHRAEQAVETIRAVAPEARTAAHYDLLGHGYLELGQTREAEAVFRKAIQLEPDRASSYVLLSGVYLQAGRVAEGIEWVDTLARQRPDFAPAHALKGYLSMTLNRMDEARKHYVRALELDPSLASAANNLAWILAEKEENLTLALKWAQTARRLEPENPSYADTLGWVYHKTGRHILARDQFRFALAKDPSNPVTQYHFALVCWEAGDVKEAEVALRKALSSSKRFQEREQAEAALRRLSRTEGAGTLEQFLKL